MVDVTLDVPFSQRLQLLHAEENEGGANVGRGSAEGPAAEEANDDVSLCCESFKCSGTCTHRVS